MLSEVDFLSKLGINSLIRLKNVRLCKEICYNLITNVFHFLLDLTCTIDIIYFL